MTRSLWMRIDPVSRAMLLAVAISVPLGLLLATLVRATG